MLMVLRARLLRLSGKFSELSKMCFCLRARAGYRVSSASSVGDDASIDLFISELARESEWRRLISCVSGGDVRAVLLCFGMDGTMWGEAAGSSDEARVAAPAIPAFPEEDGERRGMLEGRMRERGLDSPELSVVAVGGELPNREIAAVVRRLTTLRPVPLGRLLPSDGLLDFDRDLALDMLRGDDGDVLSLPFFAWFPNDDWGVPPPLRRRFFRPDILTQL